MDDLLLSKIRLSIVTELLTADWVSFTELSQAVEATAGNLATHVAKLVDAGYVDERKGFVGRRPHTTYRLTSRGKRALTVHADWLADVVRPVRKAQKESA